MPVGGVFGWLPQSTLDRKNAAKNPVHRVCITEPFWCSVYPWTQILHEELFDGDNPSFQK